VNDVARANTLAMKRKMTLFLEPDPYADWTPAKMMVTSMRSQKTTT